MKNPSGMTIGELKKAIAELPDDMPVVMSQDSEGNEARPLSDVSQEYYEPTKSWYGDLLKLEDAVGNTNGYKAVVLWPIN
jgi:hypothetical protein